MPEGRLLETRLVHQGRVVRVSVDRVRLPNGVAVDLDMVRHPGAAAVVPFQDDDRILLVRQYRWAAGGFIYEIPAGKLDGEDPETCARRELEEEVGMRAGLLTSLGSVLTAPGFTDERIHLFAARNLTPVPSRLEPDEVLEVVSRSLEEVLSMVRRGDIDDGKSLAALLQVMLRQ